MVDNAGPTIVWSRAPRNRPSMTAKRISIFSRIGNPRAGSSSSDGVQSSRCAGSASIRSPLSNGDRGCGGGAAGRASDVVDVRLEVIGPDLVDDGAGEVAERREDATELVGLQPGQDRADPVLLQGLDLVTDPGTLVGG